MITHTNLAHNETLISREIKSTATTVNISWLPQYHDMGLIGSYLGVVYCGGTGYYLSPISYLKDPLIWLRTISRYGGTHSQAPNFAFALCTRKFNEIRSSAESVMGSSSTPFSTASMPPSPSTTRPCSHSSSVSASTV